MAVDSRHSRRSTLLRVIEAHVMKFDSLAQVIVVSLAVVWILTSLRQPDQECAS